MTTRNDVYREFGKAAELAQLLETELGTALLAHEALEKKVHLQPNPDHFRKLMEEIDKNTLGTSLRRIKERLNFNEDLVALYDSALRTRNHLSHHFYREHGFSIDNDSGRDAMVHHLAQIQHELSHAYQVAGYLSELLCKAIQLLRKVHAH